MLSSEMATSATQTLIPAPDANLTIELLELELSLDGFTAGPDGFSAHVRAAAAAIDGALLFELPASGLVADCDRIAVLRIPKDGSAVMATIFACLETGGNTIRLEAPDESTADLKNFAEAFVDVLQRI
ncbi:hypothetical protein ASE23_02055 [Rhizobium sp. Root73]|uniref:hypothetical protein n=1 Tax=unclassified Rhizobium TaxID=2613769 RepID=UPI0007127320|nr:MULTISPECIES: hypothetical protein [unclassified Rhizobium]KQV37436.1 hypothetical protein ASC96_05080 [Rhizobium sp. Root1204]KQY17461.1 hypothetical protein ASD36_02055 [Rhizobium sp. Root1334]KRC13341.1 hypothetical protein ASE23_02055 [Rhizobium sp. Root73]